jgi:hypothetical protein
MLKKRLLSKSREIMTLPDERYRAVMWAKRFLQDLAHDRKKYPRISKTVRSEAYSILRHFPSDWDMKQAATASPYIFAERMEPVYRMIKQYEQDKENES